MKRIVILTWDLHRYYSSFAVLRDYSILILHGANLCNKDIEEINKNAMDVTFQEHVNFKSEASLMQCISKWAKNDTLFRILAIEELCLIPAAKLRDKLNVDGKTYLETECFRDKLVMIKKLVGSEIKYPDYIELTDDATTADFLHQYSKIIIKPKLGVGSKNTHVICSDEELQQTLSQLNRNKEYIVQEFVHGDLYHCDAVIYHGEPLFINIMKYLDSTMDFMTNTYLSSISETDELINKALSDEVEQIIAAYQIYDSVVHIEVFWTGEQAVFCEIATRSGGAGVSPIVRYLYGYDLFNVDVKLQLGIFSPTGKNNEQKLGKDKYGGWLVIHPQKGKVSEIVSSEVFNDYPWIVSCEIFRRKGDMIDNAIFSSEAVATFAFSGNTLAELNERNEQIKKMFRICYQ